jgi:hypothetical protein
VKEQKLKIISRLSEQIFIKESEITSAILLEGENELPRLKISFKAGNECVIIENPKEIWAKLTPALKNLNSCQETQTECLK